MTNYSGGGMRLKDRVAIVTGGGFGIGRAYSLSLAGEGAGVAIADINFEAAERTANEITRIGGQALAIMTDLSDQESIREMAQKTVQKFGRIDILVNNAALFTALTPKPWDQIDLEEWDRVMGVNVRGVFLSCRAVFPHMRAQGKGKIINISSSTIWKGVPHMMHYLTSKAAIIGLTRALAREVGPFGINVNAVTPGFTISEGVAKTVWLAHAEANRAARSLKRDEHPEDLVGTILFLASDDSDFMTGQTINVDGGRSMH